MEELVVDNAKDGEDFVADEAEELALAQEQMESEPEQGVAIYDGLFLYLSISWQHN